MQKIGNFRTFDLEQQKKRLYHYFEDQIISKIQLPQLLKEQVFPGSFLSSIQYLIFPLFFRNCFGQQPVNIINRLCSSGYLYFKYLLCLDSLMDKDVTEEHENAVPESVLLFRAHVYHEKSIRLLASLFPEQSPFWTVWENRGKEFISSMLLDKEYNKDLDFKTYSILSQGKCSFLKASVDSFFRKSARGNKKMYESILASLDHMATGRCLQDDFEDFKKDLLHKKNNYGHVLLHQWLKKDDKSFGDYSSHVLEKFFFISEVAETLLQKSKHCFNEALAVIEPYRHLLPEYIRHLESSRNKSNLIKVNVEAYRISKFTEKIKSHTRMPGNYLDNAIGKAADYITALQNNNGSWHEISNKQGLSNVWATAFIAMNLGTGTPVFKNAVSFLVKNRQQGLWGYNSDWVYDFDSTTCSLLVLNKARKKLGGDLEKWLCGQQPGGGFPTYAKDNNDLAAYLGFRNNKPLKDWTDPQVCVSSLAFYLMSSISNGQLAGGYKNQLHAYLEKHRNSNNVWDPYWWSSFIYPTVYSIKGLLNADPSGNAPLIKDAVKYLVSRQSADGCFKCDVLRGKSVFYTSLVLEMLCQNMDLFKKYESRINKMADWLLQQQYSNGAFSSPDFLLIPFTSSPVKAVEQRYRLNRAGGTGSITGEIAGLFSTSTALNALNSYQDIKKATGV